MEQPPVVESTNPSAPATPVQTPNPEDWVAQIPPEIKYDIQHAIDRTKKDNKEKSLTFCRLKTEKKIHTSNFAFGKEMSTEVKPCNEKYGEQATKIGDFHSHPFGKMAMGITPSEADFSSTLYDSWENKNRQIGCISNHGSKMIHCYQPNKVPTWSKVNQYYNALDNTGGGNDIDPYFRENLDQDFTHSWYDRKTFQRVPDPSADDIVSDALGGSAKRYRARDIEEIERGTFCDLLQDYNKPEDNSVGQHCRDYFEAAPKKLPIADKKRDENIRMDIPRLKLPRIKVPKINLKIPTVESLVNPSMPRI